MMLFIFLSLLLFTPFVAHAEGKPIVCQVLTRHKMADDVQYRGGVDVRGNAVVSADVNHAPLFDIPDIINVPLEIDLAKRIASLTNKNISLDAFLAGDGGMLEIYSDGSIRHNGQDWTAPVMTLCGISHQVKAPVKAAPQSKIINKTQIIKPRLKVKAKVPLKPEVKPKSKSQPIIEIKPKASEILPVIKDDVIESELIGNPVIEETVKQDRQPEPNPIKSSATETIEMQPDEAQEQDKTPEEIHAPMIVGEPELIQGGEYREEGYN